jgi:hypothetical protein
VTDFDICVAVVGFGIRKERRWMGLDWEQVRPEQDREEGGIFLGSAERVWRGHDEWRDD